MPRQQPHTRIAEAYLARLRPLLGFIRKLVHERLTPRLAQFVLPEALRTDASEDGLSTLLDEMATEVAEEFPSRDLVALTEPIARQTSSFQREQLNRQLRSQIGTDPFLAEPHLEARVRAFTQENVALIKSIPSEFFGDLEKTLARDIADGARAGQLAESIEEELGVTEDRAALIARDQVGKFYGDLNEARQTELGIESYVWRTADDERVRGNPEGKYPKADPSHYDRNGQEFQWDDPPEDGNPGEPVNCRCYAEPVIPELDGGSDDSEGSPDEGTSEG